MMSGKARRVLYSIVSVLGAFLWLAFSCQPTHAAETISVRFISFDGSTLESLLAGGVGEGWLLYVSDSSSQDRPGLIVRLTRTTTNGPAIARLYQPPKDQAWFDLASNQDLAQIVKANRPAIVMTATEGWWQKGDLNNYNLEIQIYAPMFAMWGADSDPEPGIQGWPEEIQQGQLVVEIQVRDEDRDGLPDWDLRRLIPEFPGKGYYRTNYMERKCFTPTQVDRGVFPAWPYVASSGTYEQEPGTFRPPIVVDWETGKISFFSELVTARNQNCSYTIYSINSIYPDIINQLNFESPFSFYDLSGQGVGYPNLILRTERFTNNDPWAPDTDQSFERIRYSWRNNVGDQYWDYKVEVLGFHPYTGQTPIAGGQYIIDAPSYKDFPKWVVDKPWPMVTFVDPEMVHYRTSEGIYELSPHEFGVPFFTGQVEFPELEAFNIIREGLRGEYRIGEASPISLYFSPLDGRLHLKGAQAGLFNLGSGQQLRLYNLDGDATIDGWARREVPRGPEQVTETQEGLFQLGDRFLYFNDKQIRLFTAATPISQFEMHPPTDQTSWESFRQRMIAVQTKDPEDLSAWLNGLETEIMQLSLSQAALPSYRDGRYYFELVLSPGYQVRGQDELGLAGLAPGRYRVSYNGDTFRVEPSTPPQLSLTLTPLPADPRSVGGPDRLELAATNQGNQDSPALQAVVQAECEGQAFELLRQPLILPGESQETWLLAWQPQLDKACYLSAGLYDENGDSLVQAGLVLSAVGLPERITNQVLLDSTQNYRTLPAFAMLVLVSGLAGWVFWQRQRLGLESNENEHG